MIALRLSLVSSTWVGVTSIGWAAARPAPATRPRPTARSVDRRAGTGRALPGRRSEVDRHDDRVGVGAGRERVLVRRDATPDLERLGVLARAGGRHATGGPG